MALGWGLWEGPARFIFWALFFESRLTLLPIVPLMRRAVGLSKKVA